MRVGIVASLIAFSVVAGAQQQDILENIPPTAIYVETTYEGNENAENCDWYTPVTGIIEANYADKKLFGHECRINIRIRGIINRDGAALFGRLVERLEKSAHRPAAVILNSRGGDADAAIAIARTIRTSTIFMSVPGGVQTRVADNDSAVCFSACVVIFGAGYRRDVEFNINNDTNLPSRLGIHGPGHFDEKSGNYDTSASNAELMRINRALKRFFTSIDVRESIVDDMYEVPFDELRLLSEADLASYGLTVN